MQPQGTQSAPAQKITASRIVIFTDSTTDARGKVTAHADAPAIVQRVNPDGSVKLWVFGDIAVQLKNSVHAGGPNGDGVLAPGDPPTPGCWHWPARV